jgi:hypothetical protein
MAAASPVELGGQPEDEEVEGLEKLGVRHGWRRSK